MSVTESPPLTLCQETVYTYYTCDIAQLVKFDFAVRFVGNVRIVDNHFPNGTVQTVTYRDNAGGSVFADETHGGLAYGAATPAYRGGVPARPGYTFTRWFPAVTPFVNGNAVYTAQWAEAADKPDVPDTPDTPGKPDGEYMITFRVPDGALLTILNGVAQDGIQGISGAQTIAFSRDAEICFCLTRPNPENGDRISLPFRVLVDGRETNGTFLRVTRNMTVEVVETEDSPSAAQLLRRISVTVAVPASYRDFYGETVPMSFIPDENNVIELSPIRVIKSWTCRRGRRPILAGLRTPGP